MKEIHVRKQEDKPAGPPPPPMPPVPLQWQNHASWPADKADGMWHIIEGEHKWVLRKSKVEGDPGVWVVAADGYMWRLAKRVAGIRTTIGGFSTYDEAHIWANRNPA